MTKSELKNGSILITRDGATLVVLKNYECEYFEGARDLLVAMDGSNDWNDLDSLNEDLKSKAGYTEFDIMKVYKPSHPYCMYQPKYKKNLIWERDAPKEYTMSQLTKIVGHKFKIIK